MKVLDYEQVNGDQDKAADFEERDSTNRHDQRDGRGETRLRTRPFINGHTASYMHGSHIGSRDHVANAGMNDGTVIAPGSDVDDLRVPQREKETAEQMV